MGLDGSWGWIEYWKSWDKTTSPLGDLNPQFPMRKAVGKMIMMSSFCNGGMAISNDMHISIGKGFWKVIFLVHVDTNISKKFFVILAAIYCFISLLISAYFLCQYWYFSKYRYQYISTFYDAPVLNQNSVGNFLRISLSPSHSFTTVALATTGQLMQRT